MPQFAIALRCGGVAAAAVAAVIAEDTGVSRGRQVAVFTGLIAWALVFTVLVLRRGLTPLLAVGDVAVMVPVLLMQSHLAPVSAVITETAWTVMLAGTSIYVVQIAVRPVAGLALAAVVIAAYIAGTPVVTSQVRALIAQSVAVGALMVLMRRGGRRADEIVAERDRDRHRAMVEAARRADERIHRSLLHDAVLAPLTMIASGALHAGSPSMRPGVRQALEVLTSQEVAWDRPCDAGQADLAAGLRMLLAERFAQLRVELSAAPVVVPEPAAQAIIGAVTEALRNVERHAGIMAASVRVERQGDTVTVEITDSGRGFDPSRVEAGRQGITSSIMGRMAQAGGMAEVRSRPGEGTRVTLGWRYG